MEDADKNLILPVQNVEPIIRLETNFVMNADPILYWLKKFPIKSIPNNKENLIEVNGIEGFLFENDIIQLYLKAYDLPKNGLIIEIGSYLGLSTHIMAQALAGVNMIHDVGYIDSAMTCSPQQLVFGNEIISLVKHF